MATRRQIITTAAREIGYVEGGGRDGRSGNITKYWADRYPAWQAQPWCGAFVDWVLAQHNEDGYPIGRNGIFYTPSIVNAAKAKGAWRSDSVSSLSKIKVGDIVLFDFNGSGYAQHVGFGEKYLGNGLVQTIEGNTSPTNVGSQNNGGGVYRRQRSGASIMGYVDMDAVLSSGSSNVAFYKPYGVKFSVKEIQKAADVTQDGLYGNDTRAAVKKLQSELGVSADGEWGPNTEKAYKASLKKESPAKKPAAKKPKLAVDGIFGTGTIKALQKKIGTSADGKWGPASKRALQKWVKVSQDGIVGYNTIRALQKKVGAITDGAWGPETTKALQRYLNK